VAPLANKLGAHRPGRNDETQAVGGRSTIVAAPVRRVFHCLRVWPPESGSSVGAALALPVVTDRE